MFPDHYQNYIFIGIIQDWSILTILHFWYLWIDDPVVEQSNNN